MVNKVTFLGFTGDGHSNAPPFGSAPAKRSSLGKLPPNVCGFPLNGAPLI